MKSLAIGAVAALTLSVLVVPGGGESSPVPADRPDAPEMLASVWTEPAAPDDGLVRLIVRPTGVVEGTSAPSSTPTPEAAPSGDGASIGATDGESAWTIDGGDGELVIVAGELMRRDASGELVPASGHSAADEPAEPQPSVATPEVSFGHPTIDVLAGRDGVERVAPIGDGSFAVTVTDTEVLADLPVDAVEDVPVALFADPYESYQWALENNGSNLNGVSNAPPQTADADIDVSDAWSTATGSGVVVAVIDSGVDFSHPDLAPNRWTNPGETCGNGVDDDGNGFVDDCHGWDFAYDDNQPFNPGAHAHGTHVAGIVAAEGGNGIGVSGVAPDAIIMDLNVGTVTGGSPGITTSAIARAVRYAADNGADVINMSLGTSPGVPRSAMATLESAVVYAGERDVLIVVAAGNDSTNLDGGNTAWPASYDFPYMMTVAATAPNETLAYFSNYGSVVDVAAPGHVILSTVPGNYGFMSGTSQASPVVAGIAALALDANPTLSAAGVRDAIRSSSDRYDAYVGRVPDGVRANAGNLIAGTTPDVGFDDVAIGVTGLAGARDDTPISASVDIVVPTDEYLEPYSWNATLVAMESDGDYVVVDHDLAVNGVGTSTGESGSVDLGVEGSANVALTTSLPAGRYALVLEPIPFGDPNVRLGQSFVAAFDVADTSQPATTTTTLAPYEPSPTTTAAPYEPSPTTTTTQAPYYGPASTTTTQAPYEPSPTTTAAPYDPSPSTTTTQAPYSPSPTTTTTQAPYSPSPTTTTTQAPYSPYEPSPTTTTTQAPYSPYEPSPTTTTTQAPYEPSPTTTTTTQAPAAPTTTIAPISSDNWSVTGLYPSEGPTGAMNFVRITGSFPEAAYVWFGDQPGVVVGSSPNTIDVLTPIRNSIGAVDVALMPPGAAEPVLTVPSAYRFVSPGGGGSNGGGNGNGGGGTSGGGSGGDGTTDGGGSDGSTTTTTISATPTTTTTAPGTGSDPYYPTTTTTAPGSGTGPYDPTPTTTTPSDPGTSPAPTTTTIGSGPGVPPTTTVGASPYQSRFTLGDRVELGSGLFGRRILASSPLGSPPLCTSDPCSLT